MVSPRSWLRSGSGAVTTRPSSVLLAAVFAFTAPVLATLQHPDGLDRTSRQLGCAAGVAGQHGAGGGLSVDRVALAVLTA